MTRHQP